MAGGELDSGNRVSKSSIKVVVLTSVFWSFLIIGGCWLSNSKPKSVLSGSEYRQSEFQRWIVLPDNVQEVFTHFYPGRDFNYRCVRTWRSQVNPDEILEASIRVNPQHSNEPIVRRPNLRFNLDALFTVFAYGESMIPSWWIQPSPMDNPHYTATLAYWTDNGYGLGYLVIYEPELESLRVLQFCQQHLTLEALDQAFRSDDVLQKATK
jgi:hypothetical protein